MPLVPLGTAPVNKPPTVSVRPGGGVPLTTDQAYDGAQHATNWFEYEKPAVIVPRSPLWKI